MEFCNINLIIQNKKLTVILNCFNRWGTSSKLVLIKMLSFVLILSVILVKYFETSSGSADLSFSEINSFSSRFLSGCLEFSTSVGSYVKYFVGSFSGSFNPVSALMFCSLNDFLGGRISLTLGCAARPLLLGTYFPSLSDDIPAASVASRLDWKLEQ